MPAGAASSCQRTSSASKEMKAQSRCSRRCSADLTHADCVALFPPSISSPPLSAGLISDLLSASLSFCEHLPREQQQHKSKLRRKICQNSSSSLIVLILLCPPSLWNASGPAGSKCQRRHLIGPEPSACSQVQ